MRNVAVVGVGMTRFGKFPEISIKDLVRDAVDHAIGHAGIAKKDIEGAYVGNAVAGIMTGQEQIRGQVTLTAMGIEDIPIINVESACASSSAGFHLGLIALHWVYTTVFWLSALRSYMTKTSSNPSKPLEQPRTLRCFNLRLKNLPRNTPV